MAQIQQSEKNKSLAALLCAAAGALFNWPLLTIAEVQNAFLPLIYLFVSWLCLIGCLVLYCRYETTHTQDDFTAEEN